MVITPLSVSWISAFPVVFRNHIIFKGNQPDSLFQEMQGSQFLSHYTGWVRWEQFLIFFSSSSAEFSICPPGCIVFCLPMGCKWHITVPLFSKVHQPKARWIGILYKVWDKIELCPWWRTGTTLKFNIRHPLFKFPTVLTSKECVYILTASTWFLEFRFPFPCSSSAPPTWKFLLISYRRQLFAVSVCHSWLPSHFLEPNRLEKWGERKQYFPNQNSLFPDVQLNTGKSLLSNSNVYRGRTGGKQGHRWVAHRELELIHPTSRSQWSGSSAQLLAALRIWTPFAGVYHFSGKGQNFRFVKSPSF